ncbi:N-acetyltransferase family protein [Primorskyibacter sp. S187A]|uniref:GNAT family N-acetyltransferase n=1 Tax=Primorskyibacter sp. S187A TaxID=3415130 RepID=UPI003C7B5C24
MSATIRRGSRLDMRDTAALLNEIISVGGTTALTEPLTEQALSDWLSADADRSAWHVAEAGGRVVGFQWIGPFPNLPPEACEIGTFVKTGQTGLGIGSRLFDATRKEARRLGYSWINANIRADNEGGLIFYQSRGFRDYGRLEDVALESGALVDKILKRFDLD